mgnify:FL=1
MLLRELLISTPISEMIGYKKVDVKGIAINPCDVQEGYLYIYCPGTSQLPYEQAVKHAVEKGAVAVCIGQDQELIPCNVTFIKTYHINRFISAVARNFYHSPSQTMELVGITGSHGKTTIGWMIKSILDASGEPGVVIGASYCQMSDEICTIHENAIRPLTLNALLHQAVQKGIRTGVIECSYTAIIQELLRHIWFDSIIYTDLYTYFQNRKADYHYLEIRRTLIDHLKGVKSPIIINVDDYYADRLNSDSLIGYGICRPCYVNAVDIELTPNGSHFSVITPRGTCKLTLKVPGIHNVYNALAVVAWGLIKDMELPRIQQGFMAFENPVAVGDESKSSKYVKIYVHNMDEGHELEGTYERANNESTGKLITLLSIGTQADDLNHKEVGQAIGRYSERCIIVPNHLSQSSMNAAFGIAQHIGGIAIEHDMDCYKAIQKAVDTAEDGDCILVAYKNTSLE